MTRSPEIVHDLPRLPQRDPRSHKGSTGHVAAIAGGRGMTGAAILVGLGALRGGAGLVRMCLPQSAMPILATFEPSLLTLPLAESAEGQISRDALAALDETLDWADAIAIGPGLGPARDDNGVRATVERVCGVESAALVLDADALNAATTDLPQWLKRRSGPPAVLTPHPGEMARLRSGAGLAERNEQDDETRRAAALEYARLSGAVVVLKGHRTVVTAARRVYINETGNPGMATGGMGDVLTGLIAALLAQGMHPFDAAVLGVHVHGAAADTLARTIAPQGYLAREVADGLPVALRDASHSRIGFR